eukprot:2125026-Rhodomonas_salina.1
MSGGVSGPQLESGIFGVAHIPFDRPAGGVPLLSRSWTGMRDQPELQLELSPTVPALVTAHLQPRLASAGAHETMTDQRSPKYPGTDAAHRRDVTRQTSLVSHR